MYIYIVCVYVILFDYSGLRVAPLEQSFNSVAIRLIVLVHQDLRDEAQDRPSAESPKMRYSRSGKKHHRKWRCPWGEPKHWMIYFMEIPAING